MQQTVVQPVMPAQTTVVIQQGPQKPNNYMVLAVLTTFFCNPIFGIIAWILSCVSDSAYDEGNIENARSKGKAAMWLSIVGIIITVLVVIIIPIALFVGGAAAVGAAVANAQNQQNQWLNG